MSRFPLEMTLVWDYQILGTTPSGVEVLLVAIKTDIVEGLFRTAETSAGSESSWSMCLPRLSVTHFRYNTADLEGCTMLLDIGAQDQQPAVL